MYTLSFATHVAATPGEVWAHAATLRGVNEELWPLHMSGPQDLVLDAGTPLKVPLFRSIISLLGVLPLDVHELKLDSLEEGAWFHESSRSLLEARWVHVRRVEAHPEAGAVVSDELSFAPRFASPLVRGVVRRVFERRHRALRRKFGAAA